MTDKNNIMKKVKSIIAVIAVAASVLLSCVGCNQNRVNTDIVYGYFGGTYFQLYDYSGMKERDFSALFEKLHERLEYYSRLYDIYYEYSGINNLKTVNDKAGEAVSVPSEIIDLIEFSKEAYEITAGEVNIAFGAVLSLWHDARYAEVKYIPDEQALRDASEHCDINDVVVDRERGSVKLVDPEMSLDVGAVAKGYAVEMLALYAEELGAASLVIDVGGNLRTVGEHPEGGGWTMHVRNPDLSSDNTKISTLNNVRGALVTSGDYQQYFEYNGKKYNHIIDKDTLMPAEHVASVSVVCPSSATADALSTALFAMSQGEGYRLVSNMPEVECVVWVSGDGMVMKYTRQSEN